MRSPATIQRADARIQQLTGDFGHFVAVFEQAAIFTGPSTYFHVATLKRRSLFSNPTDLLEDELFMVLLYATLCSWGMHRLGPGGSKLVDFVDFCTSLRSQKESIHSLWQQKIQNLSQSELEETLEAIWRIIKASKLSQTASQIVSGTKAIHHILPSLVPPIDRRYTLSFFFGGERGHVRVAPTAEKDDFFLSYRYLRRIAQESNCAITKILNDPARHPFRTSLTKVIDNAIMGFGKERLRITPED